MENGTLFGWDPVFLGGLAALVVLAIISALRGK